LFLQPRKRNFLAALGMRKKYGWDDEKSMAETTKKVRRE
jgi:hypothetical protein